MAAVVVVAGEAEGAAHPGQVSLRVRKPVTQRGAQDPEGAATQQAGVTEPAAPRG